MTNADGDDFVFHERRRTTRDCEMECRRLYDFAWSSSRWDESKLGDPAAATLAPTTITVIQRFTFADSFAPNERNNIQHSTCLYLQLHMPARYIRVSRGTCRS